MGKSDLVRWLRWCAGAGVLIGAAAVHAGTLIGSQVTATFSAPDYGVNFSDTRTVVSPGAEFAAGNADPVLDANGEGVTEFIDFDALTIAIRLIDAVGDANVNPLWGSGAQWVFSGLDVGSGETITGVSMTGSGFLNFSTSWLSLTDPTTLTLDLGDMLLDGAITADRVGLLTITLVTQACTPPDCGGNNGGGTVPEPGTLALVGLALVAACRARRSLAS